MRRGWAKDGAPGIRSGLGLGGAFRWQARGPRSTVERVGAPQAVSGVWVAESSILWVTESSMLWVTAMLAGAAAWGCAGGGSGGGGPHVGGVLMMGPEVEVQEYLEDDV